MDKLSFFRNVIILAGSFLTFVSCQQQQSGATAVFSKNIDSEMLRMADINVARLKVSRQYLGDYFDKRYSDLIQEYETTTDAVGKVDLLERLSKEDKFTSADKPSPQETKQTGYPGIIRYLTDENFDLVIKSNDAFVAQVKFMNSKFKTLDRPAVDAINFYEHLTPDQKRQFFDRTSNNLKAKGSLPAPDYQKFVARELLRGYNHYQYFIQALFYNYYRQKAARLLRGFQGNEGTQTNSGQTAMLLLNDKQFDVSIPGQKR